MTSLLGHQSPEAAEQGLRLLGEDTWLDACNLLSQNECHTEMYGLQGSSLCQTVLFLKPTTIPHPLLAAFASMIATTQRGTTGQVPQVHR